MQWLFAAPTVVFPLTGHIRSRDSSRLHVQDLSAWFAMFMDNELLATGRGIRQQHRAQHTDPERITTGNAVQVTR